METGLLRPQNNGVDSQGGAESPGAQAAFGFARRFIQRWLADFQQGRASFLKNPENIARLAEVETGKRKDEWEPSMEAGFFRGGIEWRFQHQGNAVLAVALTKERVLEGNRSIIISGCVPEHRPVGHHAVAGIGNDRRVAGTARLWRGAEVPGIHEPDKLGRFVIERHRGIGRVGGGFENVGVLGKNVRLLLLEFGAGISAMAIGAAQDHVGRGMHRFNALVAFHAPGALGIGLSLGLVD